MSRARVTPRLHVEVSDPQRGGYFDPVLTFRVTTRSPLPEYVSVARTGMEVRGRFPWPWRQAIVALPAASPRPT